MRSEQQFFNKIHGRFHPLLPSNLLAQLRRFHLHHFMAHGCFNRRRFGSKINQNYLFMKSVFDS
jgi:hypothetical protein